MKLVIVSNRLPVVLRAAKGGLEAQPGSGGLVTALTSVLRREHGCWVGWPGVGDGRRTAVRRVLGSIGRREGYSLDPVFLDEEQRRGFYDGFSNEIIWPLFHDLQSRCNLDPGYWRSYLAVQEEFARVALKRSRGADLIWVHDYHLMGLGRSLRAHGTRARLGFFLHIPFPPPDIFAKLPWRSDVLRGLFAYDIVGLQTPRDLENLVDCVRRFLPDAERRFEHGRRVLAFDGEKVVCGAFPIGIDNTEFVEVAASAAVERRVAELRQQIGTPQIALGVDRLDYTKGIPFRLQAVQHALRLWPELHRRFTLLQVVVPSRESVGEYADLRAQIERMVGQINGEFAQPGWTPIQYLFRSLPREELLACYRAADVALVTPLKDGMNLVAKEYCACQVDGNGVLILSEFAGAADQLDVAAIVVNPYDIERLAESIRRAVLMPLEQRRAGMRRLRRVVRKEDVHWWVARFLSGAAFAAGLRRNGRRAQVRGAGA